MFFLEWSPKLPTASLWASETKQSIGYLFSILKPQVLLPAATNSVSPANTTKECIQRGTQSGKPQNSLDTLVYWQDEKKNYGKSRKTHFGWYPAVTII